MMESNIYYEHSRFRCSTVYLIAVACVISKCVIVVSVRLLHYRCYWHRLVIYFVRRVPIGRFISTCLRKVHLETERLAFVCNADQHHVHINAYKIQGFMYSNRDCFVDLTVDVTCKCSEFNFRTREPSHSKNKKQKTIKQSH